MEDDLKAARRRLVGLLESRRRALQVMQRLARPNVDASVVLHWLGQVPCVIAMKSANEYLDAARTQMGRIDRAARAWHAGTHRARVFHEIHYYFICWDAIWKRLKVITKQTAFRSLKPVLRKYRVTAQHYSLGRDQLEHYDDWLAGHPRHKPLAAWDHGNLHGPMYSLAGRQWDVSRASFGQLERLVREFADAVMAEGRAELIARAKNGEA